MAKSAVYWSDMRCRNGDSLLAKLERLIKKAGIDGIDFNNKYVAIKIHFGEPGNLAFLRPNWARAVVDHVKARGGMPFLTDCNTLYVGRRNQALNHMDAAFENGYSPFATGCHNIIADGLKGTDGVDVPVSGGVYCKTANIGRAVMDADIVISLNHFKGHELAGFGGAIKNLGMGSGSRAGKMIMHNEGKPDVREGLCIGCGSCAKFCAQGAISFGSNGKASIDHGVCAGCGRCLGACNQNAIENHSWGSVDALNAKMAEYAKAVVDGRPAFHINVVNQVSPYCDCHGENDAAIIPDIGVFAGFDPVALDKACLDAANAAPIIETSVLGALAATCGDHFKNVHPATNSIVQITHGQKIGLGNAAYDLIFVT
ncbi:MAG: DUF362 domain-containing protein [Spirochaetaceae bacterium]|jgi:uncharacterized Fe-S center protein|nr:DUF362 domain-containing protein [Spirochaetaceae bacterium]